MTKTLPYDSAEYLKNPEAIQHYMNEAFATGDPAFITHALDTVARATAALLIRGDDHDSA